MVELSADYSAADVPSLQVPRVISATSPITNLPAKKTNLVAVGFSVLKMLCWATAARSARYRISLHAVRCSRLGAPS